MRRRRAGLIVGSDSDGQRAVMMYSLIRTGKIVGVDPCSRLSGVPVVLLICRIPGLRICHFENV